MPFPDLVIFDCDGTLVDSEIIAARMDSELLAEVGVTISPEEVAEDYAGLTFHDILLRVEKDTGVPLQASLIARQEAAVDKRLARDAQMIFGADIAIAAITAPRCVCSNSSAPRLDAMLSRTGLKALFDGHVYSARDTASGKPKPAPDVFLHAAGAMTADPARTFVIEDSTHGIHGAVAAGMRVVGFTGGAHSYPGHADRLTEAGAETVIRRWADLKPVLDALAEWSDG